MSNPDVMPTDCLQRITRHIDLVLIVCCASVLFTAGCQRNAGGAPSGIGHDETSSLTSTGDRTEQDIADDVKDSASRIRRLNYPARLSEYGLYQGDYVSLQPAQGVIEYTLNTPLFSDYSEKQRLIKLPPGTSMIYQGAGLVEFPIGTVIAKTFYYRSDMRKQDSPRKIIETRILERRDEGWVGIPYQWNEQQDDANLSIAGDSLEISWIQSDGSQMATQYSIPNMNDCKRCHLLEKMQPLGPKANNLNRSGVYSKTNQLTEWSQAGLLRELPNLDQVPSMAQWDSPDESVDRRARAYLDVNCAHCHSPTGPARNSGLHLNWDEENPYHLGRFKTPVAAGKGTGGRQYGIVPGKPEESILEYRLKTVQVGEVMPELGKTLVHPEGLALIRTWIEEMPAGEPQEPLEINRD